MNKYLVDNGIYGKKTPIKEMKVEYSNIGRPKVYYTKKIIGYKYDAFEKIKYFQGDFTVSLSRAREYAKKYQSKCRKTNRANSDYNLLSNNCCQVSARIMSYSNTKYKNKFLSVKGMVIPNSMFNIIKGW